MLYTRCTRKVTNKQLYQLAALQFQTQHMRPTTQMKIRLRAHCSFLVAGRHDGVGSQFSVQAASSFPRYEGHNKRTNHRVPLFDQRWNWSVIQLGKTGLAVVSAATLVWGIVTRGRSPLPHCDTGQRFPRMHTVNLGQVTAISGPSTRCSSPRNSSKLNHHLQFYPTHLQFC